MAASGPPRPAEDPGRERAEREADEQLDELAEAEPETPDGSPFDGEDEVDLDLADVDVGEPVGEGGDDIASPDPEPAAETPFDGRDEAHGFDDVDRGSDDDRSSDGADEGPGALVPDDEGVIEQHINEGAARAAVIGLAEEFEVNGEVRTKQDLQDEFEEVFETFQLGHYGAKSAEKYLKIEGDVDPIWGFTASVFICAALVLFMRPDGSEVLSQATERIQQRTA